MANVPLKSLKFPGLDNTYTVPQIDSSLTQEGYAADAKAVHDAVASADSEIAYVPFDTKVTTVDLVPTDNSWFIRKGYIRHAGLSSAGQISANNSYTTYCFKARQYMLITGCDFSDYDSNHWGCIRVSNEEPVNGVGNPWTGSLYDTIAGNIPTSESPATVLKGQWVAVHYYRTGTAGDSWTLHLQETGAKVLQPDIPLTPAMLSYVDNLAGGTVKYDSAQTLSNVQKAQVWENIGLAVDDTLSVEGAAADAKAAGDAIAEINADLGLIDSLFPIEKSINLFDPSAIVNGQYIQPTGGIGNNKNYFYELIPIEGAGTYRFYAPNTLYGASYVTRVHVYNNEKTRLGYVTGTHFGSETSGNWYGIAFDITESMITDSGYAYFAVVQHKNNLQRLMVVKDIEYPSEYVPYYNHRVLRGIDIPQEIIVGGSGNPLPGKTALFFGDSICDGVTAQDGKDGWAGRIGTQNKMAWYNYGTSGGTFVQVSGHTNITATLNTAITEHTSADYIILEGGTNDADIDAIPLGTFSQNDYSGSYDMATFSGAFETAVYRAVTYWKTAHVGYIVAQKMGRLQTSLDNRYSYFVRAMEICKKWGVQYLNLWDGSILNPALPTQYDSTKTSSENIEAGNMYTDGQHLTPTGYDYLTPIIEHWMRGI